MNALERIKKIGRDKNGPILENTAQHAAINAHLVVNHKGLSIPTEDDNVFNAANIEKGIGHVNRTADLPARPDSDQEVSSAAMPPSTDADDKKSTATVATMFHSLATRRGLVKTQIAKGDKSPEAMEKLMGLNARMANVSKLEDTIKRFGEPTN